MKTLVIGCGPGGENWEQVKAKVNPDYIVVTNSAIRYTADVADYFVCVENLGPDPAKNHPWILEDTQAVKICNSKTLGRLKEHHHGNWDDWQAYDRPKTPIIFPESSVGTVLYYILLMIRDETICPEIWGNSEVHLCGFPLCFPGDAQHWTEAKRPYQVGASYYMPEEVFITVNGIPTIWQFAMAAAFVKLQDWPFALVNHSGGLLDIPGIEQLWQHSKGKPTHKHYTVAT